MNARTVIIVLLAVAATACAHNQPQRTSFPGNNKFCFNNSSNIQLFPNSGTNIGINTRFLSCK